MSITTLGIDLAKSVFQLHGVDADGTIVCKRNCGEVLCSTFSASGIPA